MLLLLPCFLLFLDQITKYGARFLLSESPITVTSFFRLHFVENEGVAFSLPMPSWFVVYFTIPVLCWLVFQWYIQKNGKDKFAWGLIIAGATGNLIDRLLWGKVTDFLSFWNFPIFNLADSYITIGILLLIYWEMRNYSGTREH